MEGVGTIFLPCACCPCDTQPLSCMPLSCKHVANTPACLSHMPPKSSSYVTNLLLFRWAFPVPQSASSYHPPLQHTYNYHNSTLHSEEQKGSCVGRLTKLMQKSRWSRHWVLGQHMKALKRAWDRDGKPNSRRYLCKNSGVHHFLSALRPGSQRLILSSLGLMTAITNKWLIRVTLSLSIAATLMLSRLTLDVSPETMLISLSSRA